MSRKDLVFVATSFAVWRIGLYVIGFIAPYLFSLQKTYLGGGIENYLSAPWFWGWSNFDGEHYVSIARFGYRSLQYFFFPLFPILIGFLGKILGGSLAAFVASGQIISTFSFLVALVGFWKLIRLDYDRKTTKVAIILLLLFPTSFYFAGVYTESLFFCLAVWSFYFIRKNKWTVSGALGGLAAITRLIGIALFPSHLIELWQKRRAKKDNWGFLGLLLIPAGTALYMYFLNIRTGDALEFFNTITTFGPQRSNELILLPQVFFRYFFRIIPALTFSYFPVTFVTFLELSTALAFLFLSAASFFKLRLSYSIFLLAGYLIPTFSGSFSSLPRYVLVLFPAFILTSLYLSKGKKITSFLVFLFLGALLTISTSMFFRGHWLS